MDEPSREGATQRKTSRRGLLKRAGAVGVAASVGAALTRTSPAEVVKIKTVERDGAAAETLTASEARTVDAIVARLIPTDANGPGAAEARAGRYIDWSLGGGLAFFRESYQQGLAQLDTYCRSLHGKPFVDLTPPQQDAVLTNMQANTATGFVPNSQTFFNLIRGHAVQGMFCDPFHGGNANLVGWDLIGYPGVKLSQVTRREQALDYVPVPTRKTAFDFALFKKLKSREKGTNHHGH